ncbi:MAG TPA: amidohydrolase family protein [Thermoanaerobaculia bacterium]|jgi:beta-aspartyl-dipeptidase (metallo-type)
MLLIENGELFAPQSRGRNAVLVAGARIEAIGAIDGTALAKSGVELETLDANGCIVAPGLVDPHVHLIGGSGEEGFATMTPEVQLSELLLAGITTVVGTLGTDTTTRTMPALLAKVKGLREEGLNAFAWTGGYDARALTGSIRDDVVLLDEVIGAGELAIADRRGAHFTANELAKLASDCYVAGTLTGKAGLLHLHVGDAPRRLAILRELLAEHEVEASWLYPTHVERNEGLMSEAVELTRRGMTVDVDVVERDLAKWVKFMRDQKGDLAMLTASSDAAINSPHTLLDEVRACVHERAASLEEALALVTGNTARVLKLRDAGTIAAGNRADILVLERESLALRHVICNGEIVVRDGSLTRRERFLHKSNREIVLRGAKR